MTMLRITSLILELTSTEDMIKPDFEMTSFILKYTHFVKILKINLFGVASLIGLLSTCKIVSIISISKDVLLTHGY